jgi:hypothetical protein
MLFSLSHQKDEDLQGSKNTIPGMVFSALTNGRELLTKQLRRGNLKEGKEGLFSLHPPFLNTVGDKTVSMFL